MMRLDEIEARLAAATPGPWEADALEGNLDAANGTRVANVGWWSDTDADIIAHAPADLAALVEFARLIEAANDRYMKGFIGPVSLSVDVHAALQKLGGAS